MRLLTSELCILLFPRPVLLLPTASSDSRLTVQCGRFTSLPPPRLWRRRRRRRRRQQATVFSPRVFGATPFRAVEVHRGKRCVPVFCTTLVALAAQDAQEGRDAAEGGKMHAELLLELFYIPGDP